MCRFLGRHKFADSIHRCLSNAFPIYLDLEWKKRGAPLPFSDTPSSAAVIRGSEPNKRRKHTKNNSSRPSATTHTNATTTAADAAS